MFLKNTIDDILSNIEADTEIIVILDGAWPTEPIPQHERVTMIYHNTSIGQRAAINEGVRLSRAKFIMKCDAHCAFDKGFDRKLMENCEKDWTVVPRMYNLHVFDWECKKCKHRYYQGPIPTKCEKCDNTTEFQMILVWTPRWNRMSDFYRFDSNLHFQYWGACKDRWKETDMIVETMSLLGACFFMHRERYWEIDGSDEEHGSWGQQGTEIACKTWLSGGRLVTNRNTWFSHMFRTQDGFGFPYQLSGRDVEKARARSKDMWFNNKWPKAIHTLDG